MNHQGPTFEDQKLLLTLRSQENGQQRNVPKIQFSSNSAKG